MEGFGPLSELTQDMTPEDRADVDRIKAEMQLEEARLMAAGPTRRRTWTRGREAAGIGRYGRPAGALNGLGSSDAA